MPGVDILIGNNLPLYREVLASTLRASRPDLTITVVSDLDLDAEIIRARPCMVICSALSQVIAEHCQAWIHLFPDQRDEAIVMITGATRVVPHVGIHEIVAMLASIKPGCEESPELGM